MSVEPEVVLCVNTDVPHSEELQLPCWHGKVEVPLRSEKEGVVVWVVLH